MKLLIAYLLNLFDLAMTNHWVNKFGIEIEANPIGRWLYQNHLAVPIKVFGIGAIFLVLHNAIKHRDKGLEHSTQWWDIASWVVLAAYSILSIYHIVIAITVT